MISDFIKQFFPNGSRERLRDLRSHIEILQTIVSSTEQEFLSIGENIQVFHRRANEISRAASQIAVKISGGEMDSLREEFNRISSVVEHLSGGMRQEKNTICIILDHLRALGQPLSAFERIVRNLSALCNFIRIEVARLGLKDAEFFKLSEDVGRLAALIGQIINTLSEQVRSAVSSLDHQVIFIENYDARQKIEEKEILDKIESSLSAIAEKNVESSGMIHELSRAWERISNSIGEVVSSLQFHDITRQRVEHVRDALLEVCRRLDIRGEKKGNFGLIGQPYRNLISAPSGIDPAEVTGTLALQAAQLEGADRDLIGAVERILQSLRLIAKEATAISGEITATTGSSGTGKDSFLVQMEKDVQGLADTASDVARIRRDLAAAMTSLSQTAAGMSVFLKDMEKIGIEMQRLAINARIHSAHLGDQGNTLGVLAENIHHLSLTTSSMVGQITSDLHAVVESADKLDGMAIAAGDGRLASVHEKFIMMIAPLKQIETEIEALMPQIEQPGVLLAGDIERLLMNVHIHQEMSSALTTVAVYLRKESVRWNTVGSKKITGSKTGLLRELKAKYTMHREHQTHAVATREPVVSALPAVKAAPVAAHPATDSGELGDNVELF